MKLISRLGQIVGAAVLALGASQLAFAQVDWSWEEIVVPPGPPGSWDSHRHQAGDVVFDGTTYHMFLNGGQTFLAWDSPWHVGHWTWNALTQNWDPDPANPVLSPEPGQWDGWTIYDLAVLYEGGEFRMWYGATASFPASNWAGYATSPDGSNWTKYVDNPLLTLAPGAPGEWDDRGLLPGTVLFGGLEYRMWYTAVKDGGPDYGTWRLGTATSADGITWTKHPDPILVGAMPWEGVNVYLPEVVPIPGGYAMWYVGVSGGIARIGYAVSPDGIHWGRWPGNPVLTGLAGCNTLDSIDVIIGDGTVHGWATNCNDVWYVTSPLDVVFFDHFETGATDVWSAVVP